MNKHVLSALFEDAWRQVLDDKVFRLLVVLALFLVLPTFLVSIRPEGVSILFGWKSWTFAELSRGMGFSLSRVEDPHIALIGAVQSGLVQGLAGTVGMLFCISATAFFVPRMLEKGAADTLFSKPVGRFTLLLARYSAGVVFVAVLSFLLVLGMHAGFLVSSGWSDPAFLWSALTLTYVFALVHALSVAIAVTTRSSIAAILTTLVFFAFTGCVQQSWIQVEHARAVNQERVERGDEDAAADRGSFAGLLVVLDGAHWVLPKTTDADFVVAGLRRSLTELQPRLADTNGALSVVRDPEEFARDGGPTQDLAESPAVWITRTADGAEKARVSIRRRDRGDPDAKGRLRSPSSFATEFVSAIEKDPSTVDKPVRSQKPRREGSEITWIRWRERADGAETARARGFFGVERSLYEIDASFGTNYTNDEERDAVLRAFLEELRVERRSASTMEAVEWYGRTFGWSAPPRHNALVSILTSVLFALVMLVFARWRLARIDF